MTKRNDVGRGDRTYLWRVHQGHARLAFSMTLSVDITVVTDTGSDSIEEVNREIKVHHKHLQTVGVTSWYISNQEAHNPT